MLYKYNHENLEFKKVKTHILLLKMISIFSFIMIGLIWLADYNYEPPYVVEDNIILIHPNTDFTEEKLVDMVKELNFKFPHIVMAQTIQETSYFKSAIFKENNNLFGMKEAKIRINIARGTNRGHAYYHNWAESVMDYALYSSRYLSKINTEEEYFQYLQQHYAEDPNYVDRLKRIIEKDELRQVFN